MKIELNFGLVGVAELAASMEAKLHNWSENAPYHDIERIVDDISEIKGKTLYVVGEDNSLAEMMAASGKGAKVVLCTKAPEAFDKIIDVTVIECKDLKSAIGLFAKQYFKRSTHKTVVIAGGKTKKYAVDFVYSVLEEKYNVYACADKSVSEKSSILSLFEMPADAEIFLSETRIKDKKDRVRVFDILGLSEDERNADAFSDTVTNAEIAFSCIGDNTLVLSETCDDMSVKCREKVFRADNIRLYDDRIVFDVYDEKPLLKDVEIHSCEEESVKSAVLAVSVGLLYGVSFDKIRAGLKNCHSFELGVRVFTVGEITFAVDYSTASADSVKRDIEFLCEMSTRHSGARKIALLGDIRDFGQDTRVLHEKMGEYIFGKKINKLFTFGVAAEQICVGARRAGMPDEDICGNLDLFSPLKSAEALAEEIQCGDVVLIKISRRNAAEEIEQHLRNRFEK